MKTFRDLTIVGDPDSLWTVLTTLETSLVDGWARDRASEASLQGTGNDAYCFSCTGKTGRRAAMLWLFMDDSRLHVGNIVPADDWRLSYEEYNAILDDFYRQVLIPAIAGRAVRVDRSSDEERIDDWMSAGTASLLRRFSRAANKSTGSAHPYDRERWEAFLIAAHKEQSSLTPSLLRRWLIEEEGWAAEAADDLAIEYEQARSLVATYDRSR